MCITRGYVMADVSVRLVDIDEDNWMDVALLSTREDGNPMVVEKYVASNALSIVQAVYEETWDVKAVYCGKKAVGFVMYGINPDFDTYEIRTLMIDHKHQGKGFGTIALKLVIEELAEDDDCDKIYLSTNKDNDLGKRIYEKNGFVFTGTVNGNEQVYCLNLCEDD